MARAAALRVDDLARRRALEVGPPFDGEDATAAWVAPVRRADGSTAVLKLGMPHMEAEHELDGLRFWDGEPAALLLDADEDRNAMLLERAEPGTRTPAPAVAHPFRPLSAMLGGGHELGCSEPLSPCPP